MIIILSSKLLLANGLKTKFIAVDSTYKINLQKFPLIVIGTIDIASSFHIICLALSKYENTQSYTFVLQAVRNQMEILLGTLWYVDYGVADDAEAIHNSIRGVFGDKTIMSLCYVHLIRRVYGHYSKYLKNKSLLITFII